LAAGRLGASPVVGLSFGMLMASSYHSRRFVAVARERGLDRVTFAGYL